MECVVTVDAKCYPPGNRDPTDAGLANCRPYLVGEVGTLQPAAVLNVPVVPLLPVVSGSLAPRLGYSYGEYTAAVSETVAGVDDT